jgi:membrane protein DedA with SNARE-associated domain
MEHRLADRSGLGGGAPVPQFAVMKMISFTSWCLLWPIGGLVALRFISVPMQGRSNWTVDFGGMKV